MASHNTTLDIVKMGRAMDGVRDLVLLHSLLSDRTAFDRIAPRLALERRLWLINLPGFGASAPAGPSLAHFAAACRALMKFDMRAELASIRHPTLVVVGLCDTATPPALSHELAKGIAGAKLVEMPECGHSPHIQDPSGFWQSIKAFLDLK